MPRSNPSGSSEGSRKLLLFLKYKFCVSARQLSHRTVKTRPVFIWRILRKLKILIKGIYCWQQKPKHVLIATAAIRNKTLWSKNMIRMNKSNDFCTIGWRKHFEKKYWWIQVVLIVSDFLIIKKKRKKSCKVEKANTSETTEHLCEMWIVNTNMLNCTPIRCVNIIKNHMVWQP